MIYTDAVNGKLATIIGSYYKNNTLEMKTPTDVTADSAAESYTFV